MIKFICKECRQPSGYEDGDENEDTGLCYHCFEDGVERAEERRLERIARSNEY